MRKKVSKAIFPVAGKSAPDLDVSFLDPLVNSLRETLLHFCYHLWLVLRGQSRHHLCLAQNAGETRARAVRRNVPGRCARRARECRAGHLAHNC